jgi:uncharacterized Rmd1/YagE family protein
MECYAFCTAASYSIKPLFEHLKQHYESERHRDVVYVRIKSHAHQAGDVFFFPYGAIVSWGLSKEEVKALILEVKSYEHSSLDQMEIDEFTFNTGERPLFRNDFITLPDDSMLAKIAFSHGIAQSVKLGAFETTIHNIFEKTKHLPEDLAMKGRIRLSRRDIRRRIGMLFLERSSINLHVDVLDTPEFFWEYPQYETIYQMTAVELDIQTRAKALNQQLDVIHEMFEMLGNELNHQYSSRLELAIVLLIVLEVVLVVFHDILNVI